MARSSISGLAVALATAGGLLLYTGIKNVSLVDGLKDVLGGRSPGTTQSQKTGPDFASITTNVDQAAANYGGGGADGDFGGGSTDTGGSGIGAKAADIALAQKGKPYVFGAAGPNAFDCSGLVSYALQQAGLPIKRMVTMEFLVWSGATTISRDQVTKGDLVCWTGHIGIAVNNTQFVNAPHTGDVVKVSDIWFTPPPVFRRVKDPAPKGLVKAE